MARADLTPRYSWFHGPQQCIIARQSTSEISLRHPPVVPRRGPSERAGIGPSEDSEVLISARLFLQPTRRFTGYRGVPIATSFDNPSMVHRVSNDQPQR